MKKEWVLGHISDSRSKAVLIPISQWRPIKQDSPRCGDLKAEHEVSNRGLSCARSSNQGGHLALGNFNAHAFQRLRAAPVAEIDVNEGYSSLQTDEFLGTPMLL